MQYCRPLHTHGQVCNKVASCPSYTCSLRNCPALAGNMFQERGKHLLLLSPAQPLPQTDFKHDGRSLAKVNPPSPAATPVPNWDSRVLPSWPDAGHGIWMPNKLDTTSLEREYRADHGVIQCRGLVPRQCKLSTQRWYFHHLRQLLLRPWILQQVSPRSLKLVLYPRVPVSPLLGCLTSHRSSPKYSMTPPCV
jgi:hypothetical protein